MVLVMIVGGELELVDTVSAEVRSPPLVRREEVVGKKVEL
jgi:hypothetical protein